MKVTLKSGAVLDVTRSPFVISHKLFKTVLKEMKGVSLKLGMKEGQSLSNLFELGVTDEILNTAKDGILTLLSSQEIEDALWDCMDRVLYNHKKVTRNLFDDEKICEDYLEVCKNVLMENLRPFQTSLTSLFPNLRLGAKTVLSPESK